jgi:hypothetical protein
MRASRTCLTSGLDQLARDPAERHLEAPVPAGAGVAGVLADTDVDVALVGRPFHMRAEQAQRAASPGTPCGRKYAADDGDAPNPRS